MPCRGIRENEEVCGYFHDSRQWASENAAGDDFITDHECCQKRSPARIQRLPYRSHNPEVCRSNDKSYARASLRKPPEAEKENSVTPGIRENDERKLLVLPWLAFRQSSTSCLAFSALFLFKGCDYRSGSFLPEVDLILRTT